MAARTLGQKLRELAGQPLIVDNRAGGVPQAPYDPARELVGVAEVVRADFVLVVPLNSPARTVAEFVAAAKVSTALAMAQVKGGKLRALATTALQRSPLLPEVPTFAEVGFPKMDFSAWFAVMVPTTTPAAMLEPMNQKVVAAVKSPEVRAKLQDAGFTVTGSSRADTERMLKAEAARWAAVVKASGFTGD